MTLTPGNGESVVALQFDLTWDITELTMVTFGLGSASTTASKTLNGSILGPGHMRFIVAGINQTVIAAGDVFDVTMKINSGAAAGPQSVDVTGVLLANPHGQSVAVTVTSGLITIGPGRVHNADTNHDYRISLSELLRLI